MNNVAFLNNSGENDWGGVENWIFKIAKALNKKGHIQILSLSKYFKKNDIDTLFFCSSPTFKLGTIAASLADVEHIIYRRGSAKPISNKFYNKFLFEILN